MLPARAPRRGRGQVRHQRGKPCGGIGARDELVGPGAPRDLAALVGLDRRTLPAHGAEGQIGGDREEPRRDLAARRVEALRAPPECEESVLCALLRGRAGAADEVAIECARRP
jgi:hypothetical protein